MSVTALFVIDVTGKHTVEIIDVNEEELLPVFLKRARKAERKPVSAKRARADDKADPRAAAAGAPVVALTRKARRPPQQAPLTVRCSPPLFAWLSQTMVLEVLNKLFAKSKEEEVPMPELQKKLKTNKRETKKAIKLAKAALKQLSDAVGPLDSDNEK